MCKWTWEDIVREFALDKRPMSMKFPVAPQSMRAMVSTIWDPVANLMGRQIVCSFGKATNTWDRSWEEGRRH